jgi:hypothetical protein
MAEIHKQRMTAEIDGDFVVFLIGARINKPWKIHKWLPIALAMPRMLKELSTNPAKGLLGYQQFLGVIVQYWRSFEDLERFAHDRDASHWPAWVAYNKKVSAASGDVGIWHETYRIAPGQYEAIYGAMPPFGLGKAGRVVPVSRPRESARERMNVAVPAPRA